ncbi:MAG: uncharacterized protein A8A55_2399 [Amphiamblys sp. WSBS2006]|nr:MAG: uncharacterized protein A8A55_2399 [Amphiamblys sp. WSBS2006]
MGETNTLRTVAETQNANIEELPISHTKKRLLGIFSSPETADILSAGQAGTHPVFLLPAIVLQSSYQQDRLLFGGRDVPFSEQTLSLVLTADARELVRIFSGFQREAFCFVEGPKGTGKTHTLYLLACYMMAKALERYYFPGFKALFTRYDEPRILQTDCGGEFKNKILDTYLIGLNVLYVRRGFPLANDGRFCREVWGSTLHVAVIQLRGHRGFGSQVGGGDSPTL